MYMDAKTLSKSNQNGAMQNDITEKCDKKVEAFRIFVQF